eukprot:GEMP01039910.1.p1 GENE.GEMP01039910.1~~GEMP01039910.1.p1  ORF type:complete len:488 (+),score=90.39 GEMP01039910.1:25-1488(+)
MSNVDLEQTLPQVPEDAPPAPVAVDKMPISEEESWRAMLKRTLDMFKGNHGLKFTPDPAAQKKRLEIKLHDDFIQFRDAPDKDVGLVTPLPLPAITDSTTTTTLAKPSQMSQMIEEVGGAPEEQGPKPTLAVSAFGGDAARNMDVRVIVKAQKAMKPVWHPPWKLARVISGHQGWVRTVAVDPSNEWFCTSGNDRLIKIWDLASGTLKLSLTGHSSTIRAIEVDDRHPYLFSASEDCEVKCWDLEQNMVIRNYHGHLSGVYCLKLHPTLDILATGGRDAVVRIWDMRTRDAIFVLGGHTSAVSSLVSQAGEPQFISGSMDNTVRLWDLAAGKCAKTLTHHKKSIRAMAIHPTQYTFVTCSADKNKVWKSPDGEFERDMMGHSAIVNAAAIKTDTEGSILVGGTDDGYLHFWDWTSGYHYQQIEGIPQPGSLSSENGIFALAFDKSQSRLITGECDKTIKIYKEDPDATPETHPIRWTVPKLAPVPRM